VPKLLQGKIDAIEEISISAIRILIEAIGGLRSRLNSDGDKEYGRLCLCIQLGNIDQSLFEIGLKPLSNEPYHGFNLEALKRAIDSFDNSIKCSCSEPSARSEA
jgi:hypothetical protein